MICDGYGEVSMSLQGTGFMRMAAREEPDLEKGAPSPITGIT